MPTAFVTGISGQDGSYLADALLASGWTVHGLSRAPAAGEQEVRPEVLQHPGDLSDDTGIVRMVREIEPDVIYNLGGISSVALSWKEPVLTGRVSGLSVASVLEGAWQVQESAGKTVRVVQASSSEIFGVSEEFPQNERTPIRPVSPYGAAKAYAHHMVAVYRGRGLFASAAILYNHESPRRPETFVTRKITREVARIAAGLSDRLVLGTLDVSRDWGWAPDYVDALVRIASADAPGDFVVATGVAHTVREFVSAAFATAGISDWERYVITEQSFARPADAATMLGDASKARNELGWRPSLGFDEIVAEMVASDRSSLA